MIIRFISILFLLTATIGASAQRLIREYPIVLKTDRSNYISGDNALFSLFLYDGLVTDSEPGTDIYVDLTDIKNNWITGTVVKVENGRASGMLEIPDDLLTAYYKLRAYTNYPNMNNYLCISEIYIANRFGNSSETILRSRLSKAENESTGPIIGIGKTEFHTKEKFDIAFDCPDSVSAMVRIVSKKQWDSELKHNYAKIEPFKQNEGFSALTPYDGILVAGNVTDSVSGAPIDNAIVLISLQDSIVRLMYDVTDSEGSFCVLLHNYYGQQEVFVSAFNLQMEPLRNTQITLCEQFKYTIADLSDFETVLPETDSTELNKALIAKAFEMQQFAPLGIENRPAALFDHFVVGEPRQSVHTEDFIELNDFREITREITPFIRIRKDKNGQPELRVVSDKGLVTPNPLLLVDGVPLTNLNLLMDKGSATIKRVDTQNKPRNFGNISFNNGIVAVWTHKLDFWENLHVPGTYRFVVQGFQPPMTESVPAPSKDRLPDLRQTIYWNPQVNTTEQKSISATLSDETGEFVIEFFGIDRNGKIVSDYKLINVR